MGSPFCVPSPERILKLEQGHGSPHPTELRDTLISGPHVVPSVMATHRPTGWDSEPVRPVSTAPHRLVWIVVWLARAESTAIEARLLSDKFKVTGVLLAPVSAFHANHGRWLRRALAVTLEGPGKVGRKGRGGSWFLLFAGHPVHRIRVGRRRTWRIALTPNRKT